MGLSDGKKLKINKRYTSLDGIRAYAAIGIVLMHVLANISVKPSENYLTQTLIPFFTDFTLLFMAVSAFSMCCGYYEKIRNSDITPDSFYKKRYIRILPYFALLCLLDFLVAPDLETFYQLYANLTLCFGLLPEHNITVIGVGWFLGIVFLFYLLFPFFVFMLDNKKRAWISFLITVSFVLIIMNANFITGNFSRTNFIFCAPYFLSGGLIYLYRDVIVKSIERYHYLWLLFIIFITVCYFVFRSSFSGFGYFAELILFSLWLVYAIGSHTKFLSNKILKYLSNISMEIYLAHMVIFRIVEKFHLENCIHQNDILYVLTALLTLCGVICFAHIVKFYILNKIMDRFVVKK